jgi:hypothetical protein
MYSTGTDSMGPTDRRINGPARIAFNKEESLPAAGTPSVHAVAMIAVDKSQARSTRNAAMGVWERGTYGAAPMASTWKRWKKPRA